MEDPKVELISDIEIVLDMIKSLRNYAKENDLLNTQEYIDFEDELNRLSVLDPNK